MSLVILVCSSHHESHVVTAKATVLRIEDIMARHRAIAENHGNIIKYYGKWDRMGICLTIFQLKPQKLSSHHREISAQEVWDAMHQVWDVSG